MLFPLWVLLVSVSILLSNLKPEPHPRAERAGP
jgi:hypothetical protein